MLEEVVHLVSHSNERDVSVVVSQSSKTTKLERPKRRSIASGLESDERRSS